MIGSIMSYWLDFSEEYRRHPIIMTFGVVMSAIFSMMGVLALVKIAKFISAPHDYLFGVIRVAELALGLFALFGLVCLSYDRKNDRIRMLPAMLGFLTVMTLGAWAFDGEAPFCGWEGVFGHIPWCR
jgi:hypothetical protein